jgi:hypothetical protein
VVRVVPISGQNKNEVTANFGPDTQTSEEMVIQTNNMLTTNIVKWRPPSEANSRSANRQMFRLS